MTRRFYDELSGCLAKDPTVSPACTLESSMQSKDQNSVNGGGRKLSDDGSSSESLTEETCSDSSENKNKASKKGRCRKKPKSRSSAAEMLQFLKSYGERREKMEEEKLKV